jgi:ribosome recycling factor
MEKAVEVFRHALQGIRTGRANPGLVDSLRVEVYGSPTPIKALASVGAPEPNQIVVRPFDPGTIKDIEKAIQASGLGLNPQSDGRLLRITIPALSTDVRRKMTARIKELAEEARVAIRNVRRDANKAAETEQADGGLTEDACDACQESVQELTKASEAKVGDLAKAKEAEVMEG